MLFSIITLSAFIAFVIAAPSSRYVQHEKRSSLPLGWVRTHKLPSHHVLPIRIALAQSNMHKADEYLMDVSHPDSANFGKHWTAQQVAEAFRPSADSVKAVLDWLKAAGISAGSISSTQSMGWLTFNATVAQAENLLRTKFFRHEHSTGKPHVGCDQYHVPEHVQPHVDFITPTVHFDTKLPPRRRDRAPKPPYPKRQATPTGAEGHPVVTKAAVKDVTDPRNGFHPKEGASLGMLEEIVTELEDCDRYITPDCLRALYRIPLGFTDNPKNSFGIVEYTRR